MADEPVRVSQKQTKPIKVKKWKVRTGNTVPIGRIILIYELTDTEKPQQYKLKASQAGIIHKLLAKEEDVVQPGEYLYEIKACSHPTIMNDMCAECGADLRRDESPKSTASVPMIHAIPELKVSEEQAQELGKADNERLIKDRKLVLLVDLDQTLIHTTNDNIPPNLKDVYHFQLYGSKSPWYHTRLRPGTHKFLSSVCNFYELHICTFGARNYAHMIALFLDPNQQFFSNRILSRDECFDPTSKKANLRALFPCGDNMVCIIDDREDVWSYATNLIHVKPYHFFQHTGDINAPPGLDKHEDDEKEGVDLTKILNKDKTKDNDNIGSSTKETPKESDEVNTVESGEPKEEEINLEGSTEESKELTNENNEDEEKKDEQNMSCDTENKNSEKNSEEMVKDNANEEESRNKDSNTSDSVDIKNNNSKEEEETTKETGHVNDITESSHNEEDKQVHPISNENNGKLKTIEDPPPNDQKNIPQDENLIEVEDSDDYLIYLEDILKNIHKAFYEMFDKMEAGKIPDLKNIIPQVRSNVLQGCKLVFSGLVPTRYSLEQSKVYQVARSLGAEVTNDFEDDTTHLVAVKPGTAKVNAGRRKKNLKIVTPDWLWCCAERWERADERIFPLNSRGSKNRRPPPHCSSPQHVPSYPEHDMPALRKRTPSGRFMDTINPLMSFSSDDIADMDKEVEDILDDESDDSEQELPISKSTQADNEEDVDDNDTDIEEVNFKHMVQTEILNTYDMHDDGEREALRESDSEEELPERPSLKRKHQPEDTDSQEDLPSSKFRRGEALDELDVPDQDPDDNDSDSFEGPDEDDEGEWNMMGAALEREFLADRF